MARGKKVNQKEVVDDPKDEFLSRFVKDKKDEVKGESIGVEGTLIVLKKGNDFMMIPLASVEIEDNFLRVKKKVNWKSALKKGEKWKKRELDPL